VGEKKGRGEERRGEREREREREKERKRERELLQLCWRFYFSALLILKTTWLGGEKNQSGGYLKTFFSLSHLCFKYVI
jgi:hypothetical protein